MTDHAPTPLEPAQASLGGGRPLFLKREDVHELGAFKWRGSLPVITAYREPGRTQWSPRRRETTDRAAWAAPRLGLQARLERRAHTGRSRGRGTRSRYRLVGADLEQRMGEGRATPTSPASVFEDGDRGAIRRVRLDRGRDPRPGRRAGVGDRRARWERRAARRHRPARLRPRVRHASHRRRRQGSPRDGGILGGRRHRRERPQRDLRRRPRRPRRHPARRRCPRGGCEPDALVTSATGTGVGTNARRDPRRGRTGPHSPRSRSCRRRRRDSSIVNARNIDDALTGGPRGPGLPARHRPPQSGSVVVHERNRGDTKSPAIHPWQPR